MTTRTAWCLALSFPAAALGQTVTVVNPSFETPAQAADGYTQPPTAVPGWTAVAGSGNWGVFYPTVASWGYVASLGNQLLYTNGPTIEQTLTQLAAAATTYTLRVDVINRPNYGGNNYFIELYAGTVLLARDNNTLSPPVGGYLTSTLLGTVATGSAGVGQALRIRLGGANQTNFDNVRVTIGGCYANCDGSTVAPILNVNDFTCFLNRFSSGDPYANCDGSTTPPVLNVNDFTCFLNRFVAGCS